MQPIKTMILPLPDNEFPDPFLIRLPRVIYRKQKDALQMQPLFLSCGNKRVLISIQEGSDMVEISYSVLQLLHLPQEIIAVHIGFDTDGAQFVIGPVFAALTHTTNHPHDPFGTLTPFYEEMARYCVQNHVIFYLFSLKNVQQDTVIGYKWSRQKWDKQRFPLPHVIYNRIHSRKREAANSAQAFFKKCIAMNIPYFNERFLNKWEVHESLSKHPEFTPHLPETVLYRHTSDLDSMLQKHPNLFLKPIHGSLGRRIIHIKNDGDFYSLHYTTFANDHNRQTASLLELLKTVVPRMKKKKTIIQQGIDIVTYKDRPLDFRILCNKNEDGIWKVTTTVARVSAEHQFVSNLARGGTPYRLEEVLEETFTAKEITGLKRLFIELALSCAEAVDQETKGIYGEFGIDLAVDNDGKPWLLEINTKPSKSDNDQHARRSIRPSAKKITNFALFLSGFQAK